VKEALAEAGEEISEEEARLRWEQMTAFDDWQIALPTEHHLKSELDMFEQMAEMLVLGFHWSVVTWERRTLLTGDHPVVLFPAPDHPQWSGVGIATAGTIVMALGRQAALMLTHRAELEQAGTGDAPNGLVVRGSFALARSINGFTARQTRRFVFYHPDDDWEDLLGQDRLIPPPPEHVVDPDNGRDLRDKLVEMSRWADDHPDEPHPMSGLHSVPEPPPGARAVAVDGRSRRLRRARGQNDL
jgi:hypothetical protein